MWTIMPWYGWLGAGVWLFFGVVAATMLPASPKLSLLARFAKLLFLILLVSWLGPFAFAMALDANEQ